MSNKIIDAYYKKTIEYRNGDINLSFLASQELFSSQCVDIGTQRLLRTLLFEKICTYRKVLDLGCGYGPIGIFLKKINPNCELHMVDRDALALVFAQENSVRNNVDDNVLVYGSLGYDNVTDCDFDLIVSNIPAKVGEHVLTHMLKDARQHLSKNGIVVVVVVDAISEYVNSQLTSDETISIVYHHSWPGHHVYHYRFNREEKPIQRIQNTAFERGEYSRQEVKFMFNTKEYVINTTFHLAEFDNLNHDTSYLLSKLHLLKSGINNLIVLNPGQGYIPLATTKYFNLNSLVLIDRDLQALKVSKENLICNKYPEESITMYHQVGIDMDFYNSQGILGVVPEQQNLEVYELLLQQSSALLNVGGQLMLCSSSSVITRILDLNSKHTHFILRQREKKNGRSVVLLEKK